MKSLRPTIREKKRYLFVMGNPSDIEKAIMDFIGVLGMSKTAWLLSEKKKILRLFP